MFTRKAKKNVLLSVPKSSKLKFLFQMTDMMLYYIV